MIFITNSGKKDYDIIGAIPIFSIIKTDGDREINKYLINPSSKYIEIFDWTTKRDIDKALKKINEDKKGRKSLFKISKIEELSKRIWKMSQEGLKDKEISERIAGFVADENNKRMAMGRVEVSIYKKRYKDMLSFLRKIK